MIHYHGLPITPASAAAEVMQGRHAFVSYPNRDQLPIAIECCQSFALDNGAFGAWMKGEPVTNWNPYYEWVKEVSRNPGFDFAVIPDVIDGDEKANDDLLNACPLPFWSSAPVWHMHESIGRLLRLAKQFPRVCIGSSGEYATIGTDRWWHRINEALDGICVGGKPICKLHGLRMLDPEIFTRIPFSSADSTSIGRNVGIDSAWRGTYQPPDKPWRARILAARIEQYNSATHWETQPKQEALCLF